MRKTLSLFSLFTFHFSLCVSAHAGEFDLDRWYTILNDIQTTAVAQNISAKTINDVIQPAVFIPRVIKNDKNQPNVKQTLNEYLSKRITPARIADGRKMAAKYPTLLNKTRQKYGIPKTVILAFWGLESNFGARRGDYRIADSFLSLIYDGRREKLFTENLLSLMKFADKNKLKIDDIRGAYDGGMGHFQFMPATLIKYGVDGTGDGRVDIVNSISDAMLSAGNYLHSLGWEENAPIAFRTVLPPEFDYSLCDGKTKKPAIEWAAIGVVAPATEISLGLVCDIDGTDGYLAYPNFYRIKRWNNSNWYAVSVFELSDKIGN
jgi:lytic murein transglycosylase